MAKLIAQSGHSLDLPRRRVTLGESSSCDIPLAAGMGLAPRHFEIEPAGGGNYVVRDVSGGVGLLLNGAAVKEHVLQHGNVIAAGALRLGFWNTDLPKEDDSPFLAGARGAAPEEALARPATQPSAVPASAPVPDIPGPTVAPLAPVNPSAAPTPAFAVSPPASSLPPVAGPPVAWVNPAEEAARPAVFREPGTDAFPSPGSTGVAAPLGPRKKSLTDRIPRRMKFAGRRVAILGIVGALAGAGYYAWQTPKVQEMTGPLVAKFKAWTNPPPPAPRAAAPAPQGQPAKGGLSAAKTPDPNDTITPKAEHNDVVKRMLTERAVSLFQADLRQLVPFYNAKATDRNLPPQREMIEAFRKNYGIRLDGFDLLTCVRAKGRDEFVFVLTASSRVDIETVLGIPPQPVRDSAATTAGKKRQIRIYPVRPVGKLYGVAQYDPFTVILGNHSWMDTALNGSDGPALREATCMFPDSAVRKPGALIMVERISSPPGSAFPLPFQTAVSNLFFHGKGESRLTLTRNPDVKEETFVQQSSEALKEQFKSLHQAVKLSQALTTQAAAAKEAMLPPDSGEVITMTEASIVIPDGEALLREAIDSVAHTFMSQSPSVELILAAQKAVLSFNQARLSLAPQTQSVAGVAEALELLQNGIAVTGATGRRDTVFQIERLQPSQTDEIVHLLSLEENSRLVFRPNTDRLSGSLLDLAMKARDYRNAELIISLWTAAKFTAGDATDANTAVRKVLDWANGPGARQRLSVGLPALTADEYKQAAGLLSLQNGQLTWRPGEEGYRMWLRKVSPDPKGDAKKIAGIFSEAQRAGAIPAGGVSELAEAVRLLNSGVRSGTAYYTAGNYTVDELRAAARYLSFDGGGMRFVDR